MLNKLFHIVSIISGRDTLVVDTNSLKSVLLRNVTLMNCSIQKRNWSIIRQVKKIEEYCHLFQSVPFRGMRFSRSSRDVKQRGAFLVIYFLKIRLIYAF